MPAPWWTMRAACRSGLVPLECKPSVRHECRNGEASRLGSDDRPQHHAVSHNRVGLCQLDRLDRFGAEVGGGPGHEPVPGVAQHREGIVRFPVPEQVVGGIEWRTNLRADPWRGEPGPGEGDGWLGV
jgi:hypothetical protein